MPKNMEIEQLSAILVHHHGKDDKKVEGTRDALIAVFVYYEARI